MERQRQLAVVDRHLGEAACDTGMNQNASPRPLRRSFAALVAQHVAGGVSAQVPNSGQTA